MAIIDELAPISEEIDQAESYLVCCMYDDAISLSSSIIKRSLENHSGTIKGCDASDSFEIELSDMLESAGMVLVQAMKQLQRTSEILKELKMLFGSVTAIPVQVFVTGVCFQMSESLSSTVQGFLEEYLNNWSYVDDRYYPLSGADAGVSDTGGSCFLFSIGVDDYLEIVELYVIRLLSTTMKDTDLAISWTEKARLPLEKRQDLLRRLQSMNFSKLTSSSQKFISPPLSDEYKSEFLRDERQYNGHQKDVDSKFVHAGGNITTKEEILKLSRQRASCLWWFPTIKLKLGNSQLVVPSGKVLLASLLLLIYYLTRKKQAALKRVVAEKAASVKKALVDLWQLAFSYQVNPLAAVQPLPTASHGR